MIQSELLIFTSPVYVYHVTGQMKTFLDHFGFMWMAHQPHPAMFHKQALIITSAAGAGTKSTAKDIKDSLDFWGVAKTYSYGKNVAAVHWENISDQIKLDISKESSKLAKKIMLEKDKIKPSLKVKSLFYVMRWMHKKMGFSPVDVAHWKAQGWLETKRPWT